MPRSEPHAGRADLISAAFEEVRPDGPFLRTLDRGSFRSTSWDGWRRDAAGAARGLHDLGVPVGGRVAAVLSNSYGACVAAPAAWLAGSMLISLPTLRRGQGPDDYQRQLRDLCARCEPDVLLVDDDLLELARGAGLPARIATFDSLEGRAATDVAPLDADAPAFVQYTSGSTGDPKGIVLTLRAISEQTRMLIDAFKVEPGSQAVTWLPLSHDMGFFGLLVLSWVSGMKLLVGSPERFVRKPGTWFDDAAEVGATISVAPPFGLALATRQAERIAPRRPVGLRSLILGAEPVELATLARAVEVLGPHGLTWECLTPAYGLAEATLAVSMKRWGERPRHIDPGRDPDLLGALGVDPGIAPSGRALVSCGPPLDGIEIETDTGEYGRIGIRSPSLLDAYLGSAVDPVVDGRFLTKDLGFIHDGELYVVGRTDDMIPFGGRNVFARDLERRIEQLGGLRTGCCALVALEPGGDHGVPRLVVVAELADGEAAPRRLARDVSSAAHAAAGVPIDECVFLRRGSFPKTPSGKIQRFRCRDIALSDDPCIAARGKA